MAAELGSQTERWVQAGIIDAAVAERILVFEKNETKVHGRNLPALIALAFGAIMLAAGVLLFVSAHWDELSPGARFSLVLAMVLVFHLAGAAFAERSRALAIALHAVGTAATGAGIFLTAQIFNLQEHWPGAILLWALAALIGWAILRHWTQAAWAALLVPAWLLAEWADRIDGFRGGIRQPAVFLLLLAVVYFLSYGLQQRDALRRALAWIGGIALLPAYCFATFAVEDHYRYTGDMRAYLSLGLATSGWMIAVALPLAMGYLLRRRESIIAVAAAVWACGVVLITANRPYMMDDHSSHILQAFGAFLWGALGAVGLMQRGVQEHVKSRINLGMALLVLVIGIFYFSDLMSKLGRSAGLIILGLLMLTGGYLLEKIRKRLIGNMQPEVLS